jgi:hypothetical protein
MANTYTLIESQVLGSSAASVTFSAIPATYTDLVLRLSVRYDGSLVYGSTEIKFNSDTASNYSRTTLRGDGSSAVSERGSSNSILIFPRSITGDTATANTFSNTEIYIPSYTASQNKPIAGFGVGENNATAANVAVNAGLWRNVASITSIFIQSNGTNFLSDSSFYLYGIKNS